MDRAPYAGGTVLALQTGHEIRPSMVARRSDPRHCDEDLRGDRVAAITSYPGTCAGYLFDPRVKERVIRVLRSAVLA
jgi:hypothetical protein